MKKITVKLTPDNGALTYSEPICFIGSCFSDEISEKCKNSGFKVSANPFGVIFNPLSIAELVHRSLDKTSFEDTILKQSNVYLSWLANRTVFTYERESLCSLLDQTATSFRTTLTNSSTLFITLGTAWAYKLINTDRVVANCHKRPSREFQKVLITADEIVECYRALLNKLNASNPNLKVVFTVSPVRHIKDGLVENNRSKSFLITAVHQLVGEFDFAYYFPSYEIVIDELRDYAFFKGDGVHPNEFAVEKIWSALKSTYFDSTTIAILNKFQHLNVQASHRQLHDASDEAVLFKEKLKQQIIALKGKYPVVQLTPAMEDFV